MWCVCVLKKELLTGWGQLSGRGSLPPSFSIFTRRMTVIWPWVLPIMSRKHCTGRSKRTHYPAPFFFLLRDVSHLSYCAWLLCFLMQAGGGSQAHSPSWGSWRGHSRWWAHTASLRKTRRPKPDRTCTESDTPGHTCKTRTFSRWNQHRPLRNAAEVNPAFHSCICVNVIHTAAPPRLQTYQKTGLSFSSLTV